MTTTTPEARLHEEDLIVGKVFVHPDTCLEYEDFHAFLCGKAPLNHYRNHQISRALAGSVGRKGTHYLDPLEGTGDYTFEQYLHRLYRYLKEYFGDDGFPYAARAVEPYSCTPG
jgi:hypothetical protein